MVFIHVLDGCGCHPSLFIQRHKCNDCIWFAQSAAIITFNVSYQIFCCFFLCSSCSPPSFDKFTFYSMAYLCRHELCVWGKCNLLIKWNVLIAKCQRFHLIIWRVDCCRQNEMIAAMEVNQFIILNPIFSKGNINNQKMYATTLLLSSWWYITIVFIMLIDE